MTQDQPDRLDRIEATLELLQTSILATRAEIAADRANNLQKFDALRDVAASQLSKNAEIDARIDNLVQASARLLQTVELMQDDIQLLARAMRIHRSDGHGA